jgi:protein involved in polysaccharide export with SLBB domain
MLPNMPNIPILTQSNCCRTITINVRTKGLAFLILFLFFLHLTVMGCGGEPRIRFNDKDVYHDEVKPFIPACYLIGPGDQLEVLYHIDPGYTVEDYVIDTEDVLRMEFYYYPTLTRTVKVRPDGRITMPLIGDVTASRLRPSELADSIYKLYTPHLNRPNVTVEVEGFYAKVQELKQAITTQDRGQSRLVVVRPDGSISLPYIGDAHAANLTAPELSKTLGEKYGRFIKSMSVTVAVLNAHSNQVYVMGQVTRPDFYEMIGPITLTQIISKAGSFTNDADTRQVVIISRNDQGQPEGRIINMEDIIGKGNAGADIMMKQYDVVYVPRTGLSKAAIFGDQLWRLIPLSFTVNGSYSLGGIAPK